MGQYSSANSRIFKNTALLYVRMLISTFIALYTSRLTLQALGVEDYGIYNVVSGFVTMFAFVNGSMVSATRRYITIAIAKNDKQQQLLVFSTSFYIHLAIGLAIVIVTLLVGLWFLKYKLIIPEEKLPAAYWIFIFSLINIFALCVTVPHNALVVAYEKMGTFAYLSLLDTFFKFFVAIYLTYLSTDKLFIYGLLLCVSSVAVRLLYVIYSHIKFTDVCYKIPRSVKLIKEMLGFAGWNVFSAMAKSLYSQGLTVLLNMFFTPVVNAARGIASQVESLSYMMAINIQQAIDPQITKNYALNDFSRLNTLIISCAKFSFFMVLIVSVPIIFETRYILNIWLGQIPDFTIGFIRLSLFITMCKVISSPFYTAVLATGNIKKYQIIISAVVISIIPISYICLKLGCPPISVYLVDLSVTILLFYLKVLLVLKYIRLKKSSVNNEIVFPIIFVTALTFFLCALYMYLLPDVHNLVNILILMLLTAISIYILGLTTSERKYIKNKIFNRIKK